MGRGAAPSVAAPSQPPPNAEERGIRGRRIKSIDADFCSPKAKLIIELDGSQHLKQEEYDRERTSDLESQGYKVLRFWNNDVMNHIDAVVLDILQAMEHEPKQE